MVKQEFSQIYDPKRIDYEDFDDAFRQLPKEAEARDEEMKKSKQLSKKQAQITAAQKAGSQGGGKQNSGGSGGGKDDADGDSAAKGRAALEKGNSNGKLNGGIKSKENGSAEGGAFDVSKLQKLRAKTGKKQILLWLLRLPRWS